MSVLSTPHDEILCAYYFDKNDKYITSSTIGVFKNLMILLTPK